MKAENPGAEREIGENRQEPAEHISFKKREKPVETGERRGPFAASSSGFAPCLSGSLALAKRGAAPRRRRRRQAGRPQRRPRRPKVTTSCRRNAHLCAQHLRGRAPNRTGRRAGTLEARAAPDRRRRQALVSGERSPDAAKRAASADMPFGGNSTKPRETEPARGVHPAGAGVAPSAASGRVCALPRQPSSRTSTALMRRGRRSAAVSRTIVRIHAVTRVGKFRGFP